MFLTLRKLSSEVSRSSGGSNEVLESSGSSNEGSGSSNEVPGSSGEILTLYRKLPVKLLTLRKFPVRSLLVLVKFGTC